MKTILITGGAGFIGSRFVARLIEKHHEYKITILDSLTYAGNMDNLLGIEAYGDQIKFRRGSVTDEALVDELVSKSNIIYHFAAETHVTRSIRDNRVFFDTDVIGTQTICNAITKHRKTVELFVHISTSEVYGTARFPLIDEEHPLLPMSPYASAKCGADRLVYSYWATYDIPSVILRPFNNYGPFQHLEKAIPRFITSCLLGEKLTVHGDGSAARDWLYVEDHCDFLETLLNTPTKNLIGEVFNLGTQQDRSVLCIAEEIARKMGVSSQKIQLMEDRPGQVIRHTCDASKARRILGWEPTTSFSDGLDKTINWYKNNASWWLKQVAHRHIPIITPEGKQVMH